MVKKVTSVVMLIWAVSLAWEVQAEEGRSLKDRIRSVSKKLYVKSGRVELTLYPLTSVSLNDAFYQKFGAGLGFVYHLTESFSIGLMGTYNFNSKTSNASYQGNNDEEIPNAAKRKYTGALDLMWSPIYGKVSLAAEWILHFDTYLIGGVGVLASEQVVGDPTTLGLAAAFGLGMRFFFSPSTALRVELKDFMVFNDTVTFNEQKKSDFQHQIVCNFGLSFFFGQGDQEE